MFLSFEERDINGTKFEKLDSISDISKTVIKKCEDMIFQFGEIPSATTIFAGDRVFIAELRLESKDSIMSSYRSVYQFADDVKARIVILSSIIWLQCVGSGKQGKQEVILVSASGVDGGMLLLVTEVTRDSDGKVISLYRNDNSFECLK